MRRQSKDNDDSRKQKCYWQWNYLGNYKEGNNKVRIMMIQDYRNVIGNEIILVIAKEATTKWGWWWFKNTEMLLIMKLSWQLQRRQKQNEDDDDSRIQKGNW